MGPLVGGVLRFLDPPLNPADKGGVRPRWKAAKRTRATRSLDGGVALRLEGGRYRGNVGLPHRHGEGRISGEQGGKRAIGA